MCELLGLAFNRPVDFEFSHTGFRHRSRDNPDGWGVAWFDEGRPVVRKEPRMALTSERSRALSGSGVRSRIFIGHVRSASNATRGRNSPENTHPFQQEFHGEPIIMAHNGTLSRLPSPTSPYQPRGDTDSEQALCLLLSRMQESGLSFADHDALQGLLQAINQHGTMSLLLSNGTSLFAYRDRKGLRDLWMVHRKWTSPEARLLDEDWLIDFAPTKMPCEVGCVIATRPLTDENWLQFSSGRLVVITDGVVVHGEDALFDPGPRRRAGTMACSRRGRPSPEPMEQIYVTRYREIYLMWCYPEEMDGRAVRLPTFRRMEDVVDFCRLKGMEPIVVSDDVLATMPGSEEILWWLHEERDTGRATDGE